MPFLEIWKEGKVGMNKQENIMLGWISRINLREQREAARTQNTTLFHLKDLSGVS